MSVDIKSTETKKGLMSSVREIMSQNKDIRQEAERARFAQPKKEETKEE